MMIDCELSRAEEDLFDELMPFQQWLRGRVLNAGCGRRKINVGSEVIRMDIDLNFAVDVDLVADVHHLPFSENSMDSILSVAVLEHTKHAWSVVREFNRVLKEGGYAVVAIPFFQPQHGAPQDYVRFTKQGICALMEWGKFKVIDVQGVHSFGYTLEWIMREFLSTHSDWRRLLWPIRRFVFPLLREGKLFSGPIENLRSGYYVVVQK